MRKFNFFMFAGIAVALLFTFFAVQNRIYVPVRFTFNEARVFSFPLGVTISFAGGMIFGTAATMLYRWIFAGEKKYAFRDSPQSEDPDVRGLRLARDLASSSDIPSGTEDPAPDDSGDGEVSSGELSSVFKNIRNSAVSRGKSN